MSGEPRPRRCATLARVAFALALSLGQASAARADVRACIDQHGEGQLLRDESRFLDARARFVSCAEPACPDAIRLECANLLAELERAMPTVVLSAREQGRDLSEVRVELDGRLLEGALAGRAIAVDPGPHRFRLVAAGGRTREVEIVALEWAKGRHVEVEFEAPPTSSSRALRPAAAPSPLAPASVAPPRGPGAVRRERPALAYVLGGAGIAALAGFGYFAWSGKSERNELADTCSPACPDRRVSAVRSKYLVADILLGVGVASLGAGAFFYFTAPEALPEPAQGRGLLAAVRSAF